MYKVENAITREVKLNMNTIETYMSDVIDEMTWNVINETELDKGWPDAEEDPDGFYDNFYQVRMEVQMQVMDTMCI